MNASRGWAWGSTESGEWLSIPGSYNYGPRLADTPEQAIPYPANIINTVPVLALVEDLGHPYYRIVELAEEAL